MVFDYEDLLEREPYHYSRPDAEAAVMAWVQARARALEVAVFAARSYGMDLLVDLDPDTGHVAVRRVVTQRV